MLMFWCIIIIFFVFFSLVEIYDLIWYKSCDFSELNNFYNMIHKLNGVIRRRYEDNIILFKLHFNLRFQNLFNKCAFWPFVNVQKCINIIFWVGENDRDIYCFLHCQLQNRSIWIFSISRNFDSHLLLPLWAYHEFNTLNKE